MTSSDASDERAPQIRVSDADRHTIVDLLGEHAAAGRLTLAEHEERIERALSAKTRGELDELVTDLPVGAAAIRSAGDARPRRKISRWLFAIMGGSERRGRFRLSETVNAVAIMGGDTIDLRNAEIDGDEVTINAISIMGGTDFYVPDSVEVVLGGFALMGGEDEKGSVREPRPGAPVIRINAYSIMGGCTIWRIPVEARELSLKEARRAAKDARRSD